MIKGSLGASIALEITPQAARMLINGAVDLRAIAKAADGSSSDVTREVAWQLTDDAGKNIAADVATIGLADGAAVLTSKGVPVDMVVATVWKNLKATSRIRIQPKEVPPEAKPEECPSFGLFAAKVAPLLHASCGSCHHVGGFGAQAFAMVQDDRMCEAMHENLQTVQKIVNADSPDTSLILTKPSGRAAHAGGQVLLPTGDAYKALSSWVRRDAQCQSLGSPGLASDVKVLCKRTLLSLSFDALPPKVVVGDTLSVTVLGQHDDGFVGKPSEGVTWTSSRPE